MIQKNNRKSGLLNGLQNVRLWQNLKKKAKQLFMWFSYALREIPTLCQKKNGINWIRRQWQNIRLSSTYHQSDKTSTYRFECALRGKPKVLRRFFLGNDKLALMLLHDSFCRLSESKEYKNLLDKDKQVQILRLKIIRLRQAISKNDFKTMRKLTGSKEPKVVEGIVKLWITELDKLNKKEHLNNGKFGGFDSLRAEISKYMAFRIDPKKTTVAEFASMIRQYKIEFESKKRKWQRE